MERDKDGGRFESDRPESDRPDEESGGFKSDRPNEGNGGFREVTATGSGGASSG